MKIGKSDCLGFAVLCTMIALKTVFVRHVMGITYEIAGLVPSLLIVGAKIRKFSDIGIKKNLQNLNKDKIGAAPPDFIIGTPNLVRGLKVGVVHHE